MEYGFFDYKYFESIETYHAVHGKDFFGTWHIIFMVLSFVLIPLIGFLVRKTPKKKIDIFLKILSIFVALFEASKIIWESYYDITTDRGFNAGGILPIYSCSILIYTLLVAAWGKGKAKDVAMSWLCTIGLCCGMIGCVYTNGLNYYPFWTYGAFDSLIFYFNLFLVGIVLLASGYKKLEWKDIIKSWIPMLLMSVIASPINYYYGGDYMQIYSGDGVPLMSTLAGILEAHKLRPLFTYIMLSSYMILSTAVIGIYKLVNLIIDRTRAKHQAVAAAGNAPAEATQAADEIVEEPSAAPSPAPSGTTDASVES